MICIYDFYNVISCRFKYTIYIHRIDRICNMMCVCMCMNTQYYTIVDFCPRLGKEYKVSRSDSFLVDTYSM